MNPPPRRPNQILEAWFLILLSAAALVGCGPSQAELDERFTQVADDLRATLTEAAATALPSPAPTLASTIPPPTSTATPSPSCVEPPDGLVSWWPGEGDTQDVVGENEASVPGGAEFGEGMVGQAFEIAGSPIFLSTQPPLSEGFTYEFWVNFGSAPFYANFQSLFNNNQMFLRKNGTKEGNKVAVFITRLDGSVEPRAQSASIPEPGRWMHIAATWNGASLRLYLDGRIEGVSLVQGPLTGRVVKAQIGQGEQTYLPQHPFVGRIDEITFYDRALSPDEISRIYQAGSQGKCRLQE